MTSKRFHPTLCLSLGILALALAPAKVAALDTVTMAIPTKSFQQVIYPLARERGYMRGGRFR
ncbi:MAG: hypothetical protein ACREQP_22725 [Candidatus Binatia bacterium]